MLFRRPLAYFPPCYSKDPHLIFPPSPLALPGDQFQFVSIAWIQSNLNCFILSFNETHNPCRSYMWFCLMWHELFGYCLHFVTGLPCLLLEMLA